MSQKKVNKYKEYKSNRKEILAKEKKKRKLEKMIYIVIAVIVLGGIGTGIGVTIYNSNKARLAAMPDYNREELVISDLASILATEAEAETEADQTP